jgi:2-succinyl-6-hydroxy-2,4-cyclohexadiene-1-carboxylate synthase
MSAELPMVWGHAFEGVGHAPHLEAPVPWACEVLSFLETPWMEEGLCPQ